MSERSDLKRLRSRLERDGLKVKGETMGEWRPGFLVDASLRDSRLASIREMYRCTSRGSQTLVELP